VCHARSNIERRYGHRTPRLPRGRRAGPEDERPGRARRALVAPTRVVVRESRTSSPSMTRLLRPSCGSSANMPRVPSRSRISCARCQFPDARWRSVSNARSADAANGDLRAHMELAKHLLIDADASVAAIAPVRLHACRGLLRGIPAGSEGDAPGYREQLPRAAQPRRLAVTARAPPSAGRTGRHKKTSKILVLLAKSALRDSTYSIRLSTW